jgi:hypothetical protein
MPLLNWHIDPPLSYLDTGPLGLITAQSMKPDKQGSPGPSIPMFFTALTIIKPHLFGSLSERTEVSVQPPQPLLKAFITPPFTCLC